MEVKAKLKNLRIAPRKVRLVADLLRKKRVEEAQRILNFTVKKAAKPLLKLLNSAIANAKNNFQLDPENLYISKITVDEGRKYKRWRPRARGQAYEIQKKTSHITLILEEIYPSEKPKRKRVEKEQEKKEEDQKKTKERKETKETKETKEEPVKPKFKPEIQKEKPKPTIVRGIKRIFRRKAF